MHVAWQSPSLVPSRGLVVRIEMEKTCLDSVLNLHVVIAQIEFGLCGLGIVAAATSWRHSGFAPDGSMTWTGLYARVRGQGSRA